MAYGSEELAFVTSSCFVCLCQERTDLVLYCVVLSAAPGKVLCLYPPCPIMGLSLVEVLILLTASLSRSIITLSVGSLFTGVDNGQ